MTIIVRDIIVGALRRTGVFDSNSEPEAVDVADALTAFNDMVSSWTREGIFHGVGEMVLAQPLPFDDGHAAGLKAMLAERLCPDYDQPVSAQLAKDARAGWERIQSDFIVIEAMRVDDGLLYMPSNRIYRPI